MKYSAFIDRVNDKVRTDDEWPLSGSVTQYQVDIAYIAALAVGSLLPLSSFLDAAFDQTPLTNPTSVLPGLDKWKVPDTLFRYRDDLGIASIILDDIEYEIQEAIPVGTIRNKANNKLYKDAKLFSANFRDRIFYALNAQEVIVNHLQEFTKPLTADVGTTDYPLDGTDAERAASVCATHVMGELKRDNAGAQFQAILQSQYGRGQSAPQPQEG